MSSSRLNCHISLSLSLSIYIYIYIYIYICGANSRPQGSKAGISQMVPGAKSVFLRLYVSGVSFHRCADSRVDVQRSVLLVFGWLCDPLGPSKIWIPLCTIQKNHVFLVHVTNASLGNASGLFRSGLHGSPWVFRSSFGSLLVTLTGVLVNKFRFLTPWEVLERSCAFRWSPGVLLGGFFNRFWLS